MVRPRKRRGERGGKGGGVKELKGEEEGGTRSKRKTEEARKDYERSETRNGTKGRGKEKGP
jgi:hypothetical protein